MELTKREKTIKYGVYALVMVAAALLQNVGGLLPQVFGARCFLLLPVAVLLSISEDEKAAALLGLFAGVVWDTVSAQHRGFNAFFLMAACFFASALVTLIFRNTFWFGVLYTVVAALLYVLLYWLLFILLRSSDGAGSALGLFYIPCFVYTAAVSPLVLLVLTPLKNRLSRSEQIEK